MRFLTAPMLFFYYQSNFINDNWLLITGLIIFIVVIVIALVVVEISKRKRMTDVLIKLNNFAYEHNGKFYRSKDINSPSVKFIKDNINISLVARTNMSITGESNGDGTELIIYFQTNLLNEFSLQMRHSESFLQSSFCKTNHVSFPELFLSPQIKERFQKNSFTEVMFGLPVLSTFDIPKFLGLESSKGFLFIRIYLDEFNYEESNTLFEFAWMCYGRLKEISSKPEILEKLKANYVCRWCKCASDIKKDLCVNCKSEDPHRN